MKIYLILRTVLGNTYNYFNFIGEETEAQILKINTGYISIKNLLIIC